MTPTIAIDDPEHPHPALGRFRGAHAGDERLLVVRAPGGTGARWFASGWVGRDVARRVIASPRRVMDVEAVVEAVGTLLDEDDAGRVAVVGGADLPVRHLVAAFPALVAGPADLMLTPEEVRRAMASHAAGFRPPGYGAPGPGARPRTAPPAGATARPLTPERIHEKTGGWLQAVCILLDDPAGARLAKQSIYSPLLRWLGPRDRDGDIAETAFLPFYSDEILEAFRPERTTPAPTLRTLQELGLVVRSPEGRWTMPVLVREVLRESLADDDPQRAREAAEAAIDATAAQGGAQLALETALGERSWKRMVDLLLDHWVDLYVQNAPALARLVGRLPRFALGGLDVTGLAARLVAVTEPTTTEIPVPEARPEFARDDIAQRLHALSTRLYRTPDQRAIAVGIAENGHLRLGGHFEEAALAAERLRAAVEAVRRQGGVRPVVAGFAELQAGISLHRADRLPEARQAYEAAYYTALNGRVDFVLADAAGKLALVCAQTGQTARARYWLDQAEGPLRRLGWGRPMVERAVILARLHVALAELDQDALEGLFAQLPAEPDGDEFWAVHAYLVAVSMTIAGLGEAAAARVLDWRQDRAAATAPLATRLLSEAYHAARLAGGNTGVVPGWDQSQMLANFEALRCLATQDTDGALRALRLPERTSPRHRTVAAMIGVIARAKATPETADDHVLRQLAAIHRQDGELADLVNFHPLGWTPLFRRAGMVGDEAVARLERLTGFDLRPDLAPALTPREQEVLRMLREGLTRREMATSTYRSENTIKGQLRTLYGKLNASSAQEALESARNYGL
ncbi:helix-turn-helix transcriptional regulator [Citricoccus sp. SGAir0253]|uniref:helix-turn-helix transcriptional regulator n=1 Tax=Citricoccus sp. SGAir0253 TaxID=2567881 RepID=UPI0010CCE61F|nr:helix-turn-helix domain-containing protein [Citricoccus sp. SGAir0253]QCU77522.1 helix-turn-helix transcriptional regulator [Citricoccus sp. SGAir0253]